MSFGRLVVAEEGGVTADGHTGRAAGITGRSGNLDACDLAVEGTEHVGLRLLDGLSGINLRDGVTEGPFGTLDTDGGHEDFVEADGLRLEGDVDAGSFTDGYALLLVTEAGEKQDAFLRCTDGIGTVLVGGKP